MRAITLSGCLILTIITGLTGLTGLTGCDNNGDTEDPNAARCEAACSARPASGRCAAYDQTTCVNSCVASLSGLTAVCSQCLVEDSYWSGCECPCYGSGCNVCCSDDDCNNSAPSDTCSATEETCTAFVVGSVGDCPTQCAAP